MKQWLVVLMVVLLAGCSAPSAQAPAQQGNSQPQGWVEFSPRAAASFMSKEGNTFELIWKQKNIVTVGIVNSNVRPSEFSLGEAWSALVPGRLQCRYAKEVVTCEYNTEGFTRHY